MESEPTQVAGSQSNKVNAEPHEDDNQKERQIAIDVINKKKKRMNKTKKMPKKKNKVIFKPVVPQGTPRKKTYQILRTNQ